MLVTSGVVLDEGGQCCHFYFSYLCVVRKVTMSQKDED